MTGLFAAGEKALLLDSKKRRYLIELADEGQDTRYTATVLHADETGCNKHAGMGFEAGWGAALDQLVAMVKRGI